MELDALAAEIAQRQLGLITYEQAREAGFERQQIRHRVERRLWARDRPRVYRLLSAPVSWPQTVLSAVLAAGDGAVASHRTAAQLWRLPVSRSDAIEIASPLERRMRISGVRAHRSGIWDERDIASVARVPVTSPARTLTDLSSSLTVPELGRAVDDGLRRGIVSLSAMHAVARRFGIAPGRSPKTMHAVLAKRVPGYDPGDSELETRVWEVIRRAGLPLPTRRFRTRVGDRVLTIDLAYPADRIAIEVDGFDPHRGRTAFDVDRVRQNALVLDGWTLLRFTSLSTDDQIIQEVSRAVFGR